MKLKLPLLIALFSFGITQSAMAESTALSIAKANYLKKDFELNVTWNAFSSAERNMMRQAQKQWIKNKDAVCGKISAKVSEKKLINIYDCHTKMTMAREMDLRNFWNYIYN